MRAVVFAAAILISLQSPSHAVKISTDFTEVWGTRAEHGSRDESPELHVPARPSFFVHVGKGPKDLGPTGMPLFLTPDGTPIRIARIVPIQRGNWNLQRVDLDIDHGVVVVRFAGREEDYRPTYTVDPAFVPRTRTVELLPTGMTLSVDSDAVAFRVDRGSPWPVSFNDGQVHLSGKKQRVVALYPNGTEEVIYDGVPVAQSKIESDLDSRQNPVPPIDDPIPPEALIVLFLGLAAYASFATPRVD